MTPEQAAIAMNVRYCGRFDAMGEIAHMFNDDHDTGGSFAILEKDFTLPHAVNKLLELRESFKCPI